MNLGSVERNTLCAGIDTADALLRSGGNQELLKRLVEQFVEQNRHADKTLQTMLSDENLEEAQRFVHPIKGTAGNISAKHLFAVATGMDRVLKKKVVITPHRLVEFASALARCQVMESRIMEAGI